MNKMVTTNKSLGQVKVLRTGEIWNAVQIETDTVRLWKGMNDSFFMSLEHFKAALSEDRFRSVA